MEEEHVPMEVVVTAAVAEVKPMETDHDDKEATFVASLPVQAITLLWHLLGNR